MVEVHGGDMSARDKKDARRIQAEFAFEEVGYGGRHGRRDRDRDREPPPQQQPQASTSNVPRPAAGGNRRRDGFGGALTTEAGPTPAPARQPRPETRPTTPQPTPESVDPAALESVFICCILSILLIPHLCLGGMVHF